MGANVHQTVDRVVGSLWVRAETTSVDTFVNYGVYRANQDTGSVQVLLDPQSAADTAIDQWLWHGMVTFASEVQPEVAGYRHSVIIPIDIKVKRVLSANQQLRFAIVGNAAIRHALSVRMLTHLTGTR